MRETYFLIGGSVFQLGKNMMGQTLIDFTVSRDGLTCPCSRILVPIVATPMTQQDTAFVLQTSDQVRSLHAISSSATRRTPGIRPLVSSS